jgi:hypothetical protein
MALMVMVCAVQMVKVSDDTSQYHSAIVSTLPISTHTPESKDAIKSEIGMDSMQVCCRAYVKT